MKSLGSEQLVNNNGHTTLADLVVTVSELTRNDELTAYIVADLINTQRIRLEGAYRDLDVIVS